MVKELEKGLVTSFLVGLDGRTGDVINNIINKILNYINKNIISLLLII